MERIPNGQYTKEFREEAVKMVCEGKLSIPEASRRLSLPKSTLANWIRVRSVVNSGHQIFYEESHFSLNAHS